MAPPSSPAVEPCCATHADACTAGRTHLWGIGFFDLDGTWHSAAICTYCSGICDAELRDDDESCACGSRSPHAPVTSPFSGL